MNPTLNDHSKTNNGGRYAVVPVGHVALELILDIIQKLRFGEVVVTVHNGRIVQVEKREKTRFQE